MNQMLSLDAAEEEVIRALNKREVRYVVIGGHAMNLHGVPRVAMDLDILIDRSEDNARRFLLVLGDLRMSQNKIRVEDLVEIKKKVRVPLYNVDVLTSVEGVEFAELFASRVDAELTDTSVPIISREHLVLMKRTSDRPKDHEDYEALIRGEQPNT